MAVGSLAPRFGLLLACLAVTEVSAIVPVDLRVLLVEDNAVDDFIIKPVRAEHLYQALASWAGRDKEARAA